jgi:hypothetical protein
MKDLQLRIGGYVKLIVLIDRLYYRCINVILVSSKELYYRFISLSSIQLND